MAKTISKSVGRAGANRKPVVLTIQDLLNQVPSAKGGAAPKLKLDGLRGAKAERAFSTFQLKHLGWKGADGLVEPQRQTIAKLNELTAKTPPPGRPESPAVRGCRPAVSRTIPTKLELGNELRLLAFGLSNQSADRNTPCCVFGLDPQSYLSLVKSYREESI